MTTNKSDHDAGASDHRDRADAGAGPKTSRSADRTTRLAAQLRENLKKRKRLARARKTDGDDEG